MEKKERQAADCPVEVEKLTTRLNMNETARSEVPSTDYYDPCPGVPLPNVDDFYNGIKKLRPNANILYNRFKYGKSPEDASKSPISSFFEKFSAAVDVNPNATLDEVLRLTNLFQALGRV